MYLVSEENMINRYVLEKRESLAVTAVVTKPRDSPIKIDYEGRRKYFGFEFDFMKRKNI